jgi:hypothetical protein
MLIGSRGTLGPTRGALIKNVRKRATKQLTLMIIATLVFHSGVAGTVVTASKIDEIKLFSPHLKIDKWSLISIWRSPKALRSAQSPLAGRSPSQNRLLTL